MENDEPKRLDIHILYTFLARPGAGTAPGYYHSVHVHSLSLLLQMTRG